MQKHPLSVLSSFPAFSRLAVDLTLYRRPVFDTLTKVSSARQGQVSVASTILPSWISAAKIRFVAALDLGQGLTRDCRGYLRFHKMHLIGFQTI